MQTIIKNPTPEILEFILSLTKELQDNNFKLNEAIHTPVIRNEIEFSQWHFEISSSKDIPNNYIKLKEIIDPDFSGEFIQQDFKEIIVNGIYRESRYMFTFEIA